MNEVNQFLNNNKKDIQGFIRAVEKVEVVETTSWNTFPTLDEIVHAFYSGQESLDSNNAFILCCDIETNFCQQRSADKPIESCTGKIVIIRAKDRIVINLWPKFVGEKPLYDNFVINKKMKLGYVFHDFEHMKRTQEGIKRYATYYTKSVNAGKAAINTFLVVKTDNMCWWRQHSKESNHNKKCHKDLCPWKTNIMLTGDIIRTVPTSNDYKCCVVCGYYTENVFSGYKSRICSVDSINEYIVWCNFVQD